jgi:type III pantothenate kinase
MLLLLDVGNTHTHPGLATGGKIASLPTIPTPGWRSGEAPAALEKILRGKTIVGAALSSVVPSVNASIRRCVQKEYGVRVLELNHRNLRILGVDYPKPESIGPDRLANAAAVRHMFGAPAVVVDFGTAVTFDVVDRRGNYVGGIIAPGLNAMTDYLHDKTALLPRIKIREVSGVVGKSTEQAMLIGAVHGYRGLVRELLKKLQGELKARTLPVVATGGYAKLMAAKLPEIVAVEPQLTLHGLRLVWEANQGRTSDK